MSKLHQFNSASLSSNHQTCQVWSRSDKGIAVYFQWEILLGSVPTNCTDSLYLFILFLNVKLAQPLLQSLIIFVQSLNHHHHQSLSIWCLKQRQHQDLFELALLLTDTLIYGTSWCAHELQWLISVLFVMKSSPLLKSRMQSYVYNCCLCRDLPICVTPQFICWWKFNGGTTLFIQPGAPRGRRVLCPPAPPDII